MVSAGSMAKPLNKSDELSSIAVVVRALITSLKPPVTLHSILRDYSDVEGRQLPFKKLGYADPVQLLMDTKEFNFQNVGNEIYVSTKFSALSDHIATAVRIQKASKPKSGKPSLQSRSRRPHNSGGGNSHYGGNHYGRVNSSGGCNNSSAQSNFPNRPINLHYETLQRELAHVRRLQEEQKRMQENFEKERLFQERELLKHQCELRDEQDKQRQELKHQQYIIEKQLSELREQQERHRKDQALQVKKLKEDQELLRLQKQQLEKLQEKAVSVIQSSQKPKQEQKLQNQTKEARIEETQTHTLVPVDRYTKSALHIGKENGERCVIKEEMEPNKKERTRQTVSGKPSTTQQPKKPAVPVTKNSNSNVLAQAQAQRKPLTEKSSWRPILGNSAPPPQNHPFPTPPTPPASKQHPHLSSSVRTTGIITPFRGQGSVNDRLKLRLTPMRAGLLTPPVTPNNALLKSPVSGLPLSEELDIENLPNEVVGTSSQRKLAGVFNFDPNQDPITALALYCEARNYESPFYNYYSTSGGIHCTVRVEESIFSSYPLEYPDRVKAMQKTAERAIERLRIIESRKQLPITPLTDEEFVDTLYHELLKYRHGIVSHKLPEWYEQTFKYQVPKHWWSLIDTSPKIRMENGINMVIVYANEPGNVPAEASLLQIKKTLPDLELPWGNTVNGWSMHISYCNSTSLVWARLIGNGYSREFEKLAQDLNACMAKPALCRLAQNIEVNQLYVVEVVDGWNRVRVLAVDEEDLSCTCFFVDFGDVVTFKNDEIYECNSLFLQLPAQAICMSMYALENYDNHPYAQSVLIQDLQRRTVVGRIVTTKAQFKEAGGRTEGVMNANMRRACITALFYDTTTMEDVDLNELVAAKINVLTPSPQLKIDQKPNAVVVSHINDGGDLFVLLSNDDLKFVQRNIAKIVAGNPEQHRAAIVDLQRDHMFIVCDESSNGAKQWYRGLLTSKATSPDEETFDVYYVDDGRLRKTHISNIYRLEALNMALAKFPAQALRVRMHDVPPIDNEMVGRLRGLMSPQSEVLLKVMDGGKDQLPMVTIFARGQDGLYLCVNSAIRMEYEVQSNARLEPFDDGCLAFNSNGQMVRRSSIGSTVSTNSNSSEHALSVSSLNLSSPLPTLKDYEAIPAVGAYFEVRVPLSVNPGHFAVQPYKFHNQFQKMMKDLQVRCKIAKPEKLKIENLNVGDAYATKDESGIYHRVNIHKIFGDMIHVRFVDVGDDGVVRSNQLVHLPVYLRELPKMAIPAQLHGIKLDGVVWTAKACLRFRELTLDQKFIGIVRKNVNLKGNSRVLSLELIDTSTPKDIKIHEILINENHAEELGCDD